MTDVAAGDEPPPDGAAGRANRWWEGAVVYQVYPRSFGDASGDGVGDLEGIRTHLPYLAWLGVDAVWLSPFYRSPMADYGYDVSDHCDVDPLFGTIEDFDHLVADAHRLGIKVIVDFVPNHTSDRHPWFEESRSSRGAARRDWYWWRDDRPDAEGGSGAPGSPGRAPNNWRAAFAGVGGTTFPPAWTYDAGTRQWYLHLFLAEQPDLNWNHPGVRAAMVDVLRFWMGRGVDGFRLDAINSLGKDPALPDRPPERAGLPASADNDDPSVHPVLAELRQELDAWPDPPARMMVGEVFLPRAELVAPYYGTADRPELHLAFNFSPMFTDWDADAWRLRVDEVETLIGGVGDWPTWMLSTHDRPRHRTRYGTEARARAAAVLVLTLRGTPFLYQGEELGLEDAVVPAERRLDPGGRDGCRAPFPWDAAPAHGWAGGPDAWLPWPPGAGEDRNVAVQRSDPASTLHLYRRLLAARRASAALRGGSFTWLPSPDGVLAYRRAEPGGDVRVVVVNFVGEPATVDLPAGTWTVEVGTHGPAGVEGGGPDRRVANLALAADEAVVLRPAGLPGS